MTFWLEVAAGFLSNIAAGVLLVAFYVAIQWFLQITDIGLNRCAVLGGASRLWPSVASRWTPTFSSFLLTSFA